MFSIVFAPFGRLFTVSRPPATTASAKLEETVGRGDGGGQAKAKRDIIDHLQVPPARKDVPLLDLIQASKRRTVTGDFEIVPPTKGVLVLDEGEVGAEEWPNLTCKMVNRKGEEEEGGRASYAQVTKGVPLNKQE